MLILSYSCKIQQQTYLLDSFLMIQKIIITTITIPIIPTQTPALKIVPIAAQLLSEIIAANKTEDNINLLLFILVDLRF
ncbi:MAG: hypothetical protein ABI359_11210 [Ginsengibacter sp.]